MKIILAIAAMVAMHLTAYSQAPKAKGKAAGPVVEIKGLRLGMPEAEAAAIYRAMPDVTVAGASPKFAEDPNPLGLKYENGALSQLVFFFAPADFDQVRSALKTKYPSLKCETSSVNNRAGAKFTQEECKLASGDTMLSLSKFVNDIQTSALTMMSIKKLTDSADARQKAATSDL